MPKSYSKKRTNRIFYLLVLLMITASTLSFSTYAWFTTNRLVKIDLLNVNIRSEGGIEISADAINWKPLLNIDDIQIARDNYPNSENQVPTSLEAVSTSGNIEDGKLMMYYGVATNDPNGDYILTSTRSIEKEAFENNTDSKFIAFDIFLKTNMNTKLYLTPKSNVLYGGDTSYGTENAIRIAFINEGNIPAGSDVNTIQNLITNNKDNVYIWEPNYDNHTESGINNAKNVYGITTTSPGNQIPYYGLKNEFASSSMVKISDANSDKYPNFFERVEVDIKTSSNFSENIEAFDITNGITKYRIYVWIEGQDVDCENDAKIGNVLLNLQLSTNPN